MEAQQRSRVQLWLVAALLWQQQAPTVAQAQEMPACNSTASPFDLMLSLGQPTTSTLMTTYPEIYKQLLDPSVSVTLFFFIVKSNPAVFSALQPLYAEGDVESTATFLYTYMLQATLPGKQCLRDLLDQQSVNSLLGLMLDASMPLEFDVDEEGEVRISSPSMSGAHVLTALESCTSMVYVVTQPLWMPDRVLGLSPLPTPINISALVAKALPERDTPAVCGLEVELLTDPANYTVDPSILTVWSTAPVINTTGLGGPSGDDTGEGTDYPPGTADDGGGGGSAVAVAVGVSVGGVALLAVGAVLAAVLYRRRQRKACSKDAQWKAVEDVVNNMPSARSAPRAALWPARLTGASKMGSVTASQSTGRPPPPHFQGMPLLPLESVVIGLSSTSAEHSGQAATSAGQVHSATAASSDPLTGSTAHCGASIGGLARSASDTLAGERNLSARGLGPVLLSDLAQKEEAGAGAPGGGKAEDVAALGPAWGDVLIAPQDLQLMADPMGHPVKLGAGSYGTVFRGVRNGSTPVAVKVPQLQQLSRASDRERERRQLLKEARNLQACRDPHVVQFLGVCFQGDSLLLVTEFMAGGDLYNALTCDAREYYMWEQHGKRLALEIAKGLVYLHAKKFAHMDLKPNNLLLSSRLEPHAKIADLGMSTVLTQDYLSAALPGTFNWAAPELLMGAKVTVAADMYSFGVILWQVVTGGVPRRGNLDFEGMEALCPEQLVKMIKACLSVDPRSRPTAKEAHDIIEGLVGPL